MTEGETLYLDLAHVRDDRFSYDLSDTDPTDGLVTGWEQYPAGIDVTFAAVSSVEQVVAGEIDVGMVNGLGPAAVALRNDTADAFTEASDTATFATDFADATQLLQARVTLGREGSDGDTSGTFGDVPHKLDTLRLFANLVNTPVLLNFVHSGTYLDGLNRIADAGDFIWELWRAPEADAPYRIVCTQPGQRVAADDPDIVDFQGRRTIDDSYQRVIAEGKSTRVEGETVPAAEPGLGVGLDNAPLVPGKETVYGPGNRDTQYEGGLDYTLDHAAGALTIREGGAMSADTEYAIDYAWRFQGQYTQPDVADPDTLREQFPAASSDRECERLALAVVRQVAAPLEEATVTITDVAPDRSLVAAIDPAALPFDGPLRVRSIDGAADRVQLTLGGRRSAEDVIETLQDRVAAVARNT